MREDILERGKYGAGKGDHCSSRKYPVTGDLWDGAGAVSIWTVGRGFLLPDSHGKKKPAYRLWYIWIMAWIKKLVCVYWIWDLLLSCMTVPRLLMRKTSAK